MGLKASDAQVEMAEVLRITPRAEQHLTRVLRERDRDYWPNIGSGNRGAVRVRHLLCNTVAAGLAPGQPSDGLRLLEEFEALRPSKTRLRWADENQPSANPLKQFSSAPSNFKERVIGYPEPGALDRSLIDVLTDLVQGMVSNFTSGRRPAAQCPTIRITLGNMGLAMTAEVEWPSAEEQGSAGIDEYRAPKGTLPGLDLPAPQKPMPYRTQVIIGALELLALVSIAARTGEVIDLVDQAQTLASTKIEIPDSGSPADAGEGEADPEMTKAAGLGSHNGLCAERPATQTAPLDKAQSNPSKASKQSAFDSGRRGSQVRQHTATARTRHHEPHWADAASP